MQGFSTTILGDDSCRKTRPFRRKKVTVMHENPHQIASRSHRKSASNRQPLTPLTN